SLLFFGSSGLGSDRFLIVWSKASPAGPLSTRRIRRSDPLPGVVPGGAEEGVDDPHVLDGIVEREGDRLAAADRLREQIALDGVLVADRKALDLLRDVAEPAAVVDEDAAGLVRRRIEGDLDGDPALGAEDLHALVGHQLGRADEARLSLRIVEDGARQAVDL